MSLTPSSTHALRIAGDSALQTTKPSSSPHCRKSHLSPPHAYIVPAPVSTYTPAAASPFQLQPQSRPAQLTTPPHHHRSHACASNKQLHSHPSAQTPTTIQTTS
ncbi:hypothetical protein K458DRAFT_402518 [Lentithecium fluviatile CBS 122367]|uniref:Uncharacterized protein n=1 Tax=Lentithecium fluviatile CBS 122367 TaxID=1168545 RepID=A0A6G1J9U9_9PLEO|nr:hypothetical protein K458DRAFT_402518 [Lentithecium fluviatile CBS 122367]